MARRDENARDRHEPKKRSVLLDIVACLLPIVSLAGSLALATFIFRHVDNAVKVSQEALAGAAPDTGTGEVAPQTVYAGVDDPWNASGSFTVEDEELDAYIRDYCDAHTMEGDTAEQAAERTYDDVVQSSYLYRVDKPMGLDWVARSAREFFRSGAETGEYQGDAYEFSAVMALCLRYFDYGDAIAVPIVYSESEEGQEGSALCLVTDKTTGMQCVCDPTLGTEGWMLPRTGYSILVDDIGQNLDPARGLGLRIQEKDETPKNPDGTDAVNPMGGTNGYTGMGSGYGEYGTESDYGTETGYGTSNGYGTGTSNGAGNGYGSNGYGSSGGYGTDGYGDTGSNGYGSSGTSGRTSSGSGTSGTTGGSSPYGGTGYGSNADSYDEYDSYGYDDASY